MVMGLEDRSPRQAELAQMIALLEDGLHAGALGHVVGPVHSTRQLCPTGKSSMPRASR
jgi:N-acyl-D-aspartate/D-glutamate deacylase